MVLLEYESLRFSEEKDIRVTFQNIFYFCLKKKDLEDLGEFTVQPKGIEFATGKKEANVRQKFEFLLTKGFEDLFLHAT